MPALFSNYATATLASNISSSDTTIVVSTGQGALFPTIVAGSFFYATLVDSSNNLEIIKVTNRVSDQLTVLRGQESSIARAYVAADKVELRVTAAVLSNFVQLDGAQTVTGVKTFSGGLAGNLTGSVTGNVTGNVTGDVTGDLTGTADQAVKLATTNFSIEQVGANLIFKNGSTVIAKLDASGNFTALGNVTAYGVM